MNLELNAQINKENHAQHIFVAGRIDTLTYKQFETFVLDRISDETPNIIIDMKNVDYVSSSGLRAFIIAQKALQALNSKLVIQHCDPSVKMVFDVSGLTGLFRFE